MSPKEQSMARETDEFQSKSFFKLLINSRTLDGAHSAAVGSAHLAQDKGWEAMSVGQKATLRDFVRERCIECGETIPWCERYAAIESGKCVNHNPELTSVG